MLIGLFAKKIEGCEPRIVDLEQPILVIGVAVSTDLRRISRDAPALGKRWRDLKRDQEIPNKKATWDSRL